MKLKAHKKKCREFFRNIKKGKTLYVSVERTISENELGETQIEEISLEDTFYVRVSILTDEILAYDSEMFSIENRTQLLNSYRPYFTSFTVPLEENSLRDIEFLGSEWYIGQFKGLEEVCADEGIILKGILQTSASPVNYLNGNLLVFKNRAIKKEVLDKINNTYNPHNFSCTSRSDIEKILNDAWSKDFPQTIDIYNIGHGNADYLKGIKNRILYDVGYNYRSFPQWHKSKYLRAVHAIRHLKPSCVILSHWDMDHIIGCAYAKQDIFSVKWVAPYLVSSKDKKATVNSIRLAHYLKVLGNLCLVDREQPNTLIATISCKSSVNMKLWLGRGTSRITPKNREGLLIEIYDEKKKYPHILLSGDVPYKCMPNILNSKIDFMHVPHHCSKMELDILHGMPGNGVCAIVSTNRKKNGLMNYDLDHHMELVNKFKDVVNTIDNTMGDDEANLSVQIDYPNSSFGFR